MPEDPAVAVPIAIGIIGLFFGLVLFAVYLFSRSSQGQALAEEAASLRASNEQFVGTKLPVKHPEWQAPPELIAATIPRRVQFTGRGLLYLVVRPVQGVLGLFLGFLGFTWHWVGFLLGGVFLYAAVYGSLALRKERKLLQSGRPTYATIRVTETIEEERQPIGRERRREYVTILSYHFISASGRSVSGMRRISRWDRGRWEKANTVLYDTKNPQNSTVYPALWFRLAG